MVLISLIIQNGLRKRLIFMSQEPEKNKIYPKIVFYDPRWKSFRLKISKNPMVYYIDSKLNSSVTSIDKSQKFYL